jgi:signal transduction histidine kinase
LRHAVPARVDVKLAARNGSVVLEVVDDGRGFDPETAGGAARRLGLASMRERARTAGGRLTIRSRRGGGTTVRVEVPTSG